MGKINTNEIIYNINNYSRFEWFYNLMYEVNLLSENQPELNIRKDFLDNIAKTQLNGLKLGYSILNMLYNKFISVLDGKKYPEIFINDVKDLVIEKKDNTMMIFKKPLYEKFKNLKIYFEPYINEPEQQNEIYKNMKWNKEIIDLSELIYVLVKSESIYKNGKNITQKDLTEIFNKIFNTDITNVSDNLNKGFQRYKRSEDKKTYIKSLYEIIEQYIIDKNNKK